MKTDMAHPEISINLKESYVKSKSEC